MAMLINPADYNSLPSLGEANVSRQASFVDDVINGPIRDVFIKHGVQDSLCLYLQHRHHTVGADQAIVKVNGSAHLMNSQDIKEIISFGNKIVPATWMASAGNMIPMEFAVVPDTTGETPAPAFAFIMEFLYVLASNGCNNLFGVDTIAKGAWAEMTIGDTSVVVPSNNSHNDKFITVAFAFHEDKPKFIEHGKCGKDHKHTSKPPPPPRPPK